MAQTCYQGKSTTLKGLPCLQVGGRSLPSCLLPPARPAAFQVPACYSNAYFGFLLIGLRQGLRWPSLALNSELLILLPLPPEFGDYRHVTATPVCAVLGTEPMAPQAIFLAWILVIDNPVMFVTFLE